MGRLTSVVLEKLVYPPVCLTCDEMVETLRGICPACWSGTTFIEDVPCDSCGRPLLGDAREGDLCEDCHKDKPLWTQGRAVMCYEDNARKLVLRLKHGDRTDLAFVAGNWMSKSAETIATPEHIVAPVPLHWFRTFRRRYNQSALLSARIAKNLNLTHRADLLKRTAATKSLEGKNAKQRAEIVDGAICINPRRSAQMSGKPVLLVDDVMTTGATLTQCAKACLEAGASRVDVVVLARVASRR